MNSISKIQYIYKQKDLNKENKKKTWPLITTTLPVCDFPGYGQERDTSTIILGIPAYMKKKKLFAELITYLVGHYQYEWKKAPKRSRKKQKN